MSDATKVVELSDVCVRFSGDSGDGMQLTGTLFSDASALIGNDIATFPDYPSEIRAPQGTVAGVSGFQVNFGSKKIYTPGDKAHMLVAMNPAAIKANVDFLQPGAVIVYDSDSFTKKNLEKANFKTDDPFKELNLIDFRKIAVPISTLTATSLEEFDLDKKSVLRSKNMFALGVVCYLFDRKLDLVEKALENKFAKKPQLVKFNIKVLHDGFNFGSNMQHTTPRFSVHSSDQIEKGTYRTVSGNQATAWGLLAASVKAEMPLFIGSYPITPATDILHFLAERKDLGVKSFQAEDEIAGICTSIGAAFAGNFAVTTTSGPGLALKGEAIGLAIMAELPLVIVNVQRGGPSTGLPTKTEQSDLMQALYGRNGESPAVVIAASTPSDCFDYAFMASKIALERMVPVILLTDGFLGNGSAPWKIPATADLDTITPKFATNPEGWKPFARDENFSREWAVPGMDGFQHRVGGLEKNEAGQVSHDAENHQVMTDLRQAKVDKVANMIPELEVYGDQDGGDILVVGWGGTYGHLKSAVDTLREEGKSVSLAHFNYIMPLPSNTEELLSKYKKIVVCELNMGQFAAYLRNSFSQFEFKQINQVRGLPFQAIELAEGITKILEE